MLYPQPLVYGSDPELFFQKAGVIVGAEKVIPKRGLSSMGGINPYHPPEVVLDGVQVELHPTPHRNVFGFGSALSTCFRLIENHLRDVPGVTVNYDGVVEVTQSEYDDLSDECKQLGCMPSKNIYGEKPITVDPSKYLKRSAGGHLHFDLRQIPLIFSSMTDERKRCVRMLDAFVGAFCVLLDRDPGAAERRKNYGRAGEYRDDKEYGLEYRTLSNFWLRAFPLTDFVFGMGNLAISIAKETMKNPEFDKELLKAFDSDLDVEAIDQNDWDKARANVERFRPVLMKHLPDEGFPLNPKNFDKFLVFAQGVKENGLKTYFPDDPMMKWIGGGREKFEKFLERI